MAKKYVVLNSDGKPVTLSKQEKHNVKWLSNQLESRVGQLPNTPMLNSIGYEVAITTLTQIHKKISEQKFFEVKGGPAAFIPMPVGNAPFSQQITTFRSFDAAEQFETGIINSGSPSSRLAQADAAVDALNIKVYPWAKGIAYSIFDLEFAARSGNWDLASAKEKSRKRNWDLGVQRLAFLGARGLNGSSGTCLGLLNQPGVTINTSVITSAISGLAVGPLKTFVATLMEAYRSNCNRTAWPNRFVIPESDYNGMASQASADFPIKSVLQLLEEAFKLIAGDDFKILPLAYADQAYHADVASIAGKQVYTLYRADEESLRMDIPLDYTTTLANSLDNFSFQNAAYGQFTGVLAYRPLEMMYFMF